MGRRSLTALLALILMMSSAVVSFADNGSRSDSEKKHITVQEQLPQVKIYCEEYSRSSSADKKDIEVQAYSGKTELKNSVRDVSIFSSGKSSEGITYFILLDASGSMNNNRSASFSSIKEDILSFTNSQLNSKDKVFLLPFSSEIKSGNEKGMNPTTSDIRERMNSISASGGSTNIYNALGHVCEIAEQISKDEQYPDRKEILLFTDAREFNDGGDEKTSRDVDLASAGICIHAFTIGGVKKDKDTLREFVIDSGGTVYDGLISADLKTMKESLDKSLVVTAEIKNVSDMIGKYDVKVYQDSQLIGEKSSLSVPNTKGVKDATSIVIKKAFLRLWWIILIIAIAAIAFVVLTTIKKNRGLVKVDGKVVYGGSIQKKYHIKGKPQKTAELTLRIESKAGEASVQHVEMESSLIVGRASQCDLYFDDAKMSRQHFVITIENRQLFIQDLESTGGTYLNGIGIFEKQKLSRGSIITAGATKIIVEDIDIRS